jgi:hypothetical protein
MESLEGAPDWVQETVERCLHDMQQPSVVDLRLTWSPDDASLGLDEPVPDGSGGGFSFSPRARSFLTEEAGLSERDAQSGVAVVVAFAHLLQDQVFWESQAAWGEARPVCPGHPHPATPRVVNGEAWWTCPATRQPLWLIGSYEHPSRT